MTHTLTLPLVLLLTVGTAASQDHLFGVGFADNVGPSATGGNSFPVTRYRDLDKDGLIDANTELFPFLRQCFSGPQGNGNAGGFFADLRAVAENGEYAFYFVDSSASGAGCVMRGVDLDHDGVLSNAEVTLFHSFGTSNAPDSIAVHRDVANGRTIVYVALDTGRKGIHRLVDLNGDGDAQDAGEASVFVDATKGLTVPGTNGPVALVADAWIRVRVTPSGRVLAYNHGPNQSSTPRTPDMFAWYAFTDSNGTASAQLWFNPSTLNGLPTHPDFATGGRFPNYDLQNLGGTQFHPTFAHVSMLEIDPRGVLPGYDAYYITADYRPTGWGNTNLNNQVVSGLVYRVVDRNFNEQIDAGELDLYVNVSGQTWNNVAPIALPDRATQTSLTTLNDLVQDIGAADGALHVYGENRNRDCVWTCVDANSNGVIEANEVVQPFFTPSPFPYPFSVQFGPFGRGSDPIRAGTMPGPFPAGLAPEGRGCATTGSMFPVMDALGGEPRHGNAGFEIGMLRGMPGQPVTMLLGLQRATVDLGVLNMPGCTLYTLPLLNVGPIALDGLGRTYVPLPLPNDPTLVGLAFTTQFAIVDLSATNRLPVFTTNALRVTVR